MARYIDAEKLRRHMQKVSTEAWKMNLHSRVETVWNQAIEIIDDAPSVQIDIQRLLDDGTLIVHTDYDMTKIKRVNLTQNGTHWGDLFYPDEE